MFVNQDSEFNKTIAHLLEVREKVQFCCFYQGFSYFLYRDHLLKYYKQKCLHYQNQEIDTVTV